MAVNQDVTLETLAGALVVRGECFNESAVWRIMPVSRQRYLIESDSVAKTMKGAESGLGRLHHKTFVAMLIGLVEQKFDGVLSIDLGVCVKRLYFSGGELVFAASNLIDDRLGEVIYRAERITLDQLIEAAVEVNRATKFGRVLLSNRVFSNSQLWDALILQVLSIFQSVFLHEYVYIQLMPGLHLSPTAVSLGKTTSILIEELRCYAEEFRHFKEKLNSACKLVCVESVCARLGANPGTFRGDMVELVRAHSSVSDFLAHSKLTQTNSLSSLFDMVNRHIIKIENFDTSTRGIDSGVSIKELKSLVDAYHLLIDGVKKAFQIENSDFPIVDIELFLDRQYSNSRSPVFVQQDATIAPIAVVNLYINARTSIRQAEIMARHLQALILFTMQMAGDLLPGTKGSELKRTFQSMVT